MLTLDADIAVDDDLAAEAFLFANRGEVREQIMLGLGQGVDVVHAIDHNATAGATAAQAATKGQGRTGLFDHIDKFAAGRDFYGFVIACEGDFWHRVSLKTLKEK